MRIKLLTGLLIITALLWQTPSHAARRAEISIYNGMKMSVAVSVEVAVTFEARSKGLMNREALGEREGMLFVFKGNELWSIWMKDMLIPLDIIFISRDLQVINYVEGAKPCKAAPCDRYNSERPAGYVLEVNAGFIEKYGIKKGSVIEIRE